jgi:ketosteroid isomerase-like protein
MSGPSGASGSTNPIFISPIPSTASTAPIVSTTPVVPLNNAASPVSSTSPGTTRPMFGNIQNYFNQRDVKKKEQNLEKEKKKKIADLLNTNPSYTDQQIQQIINADNNVITKTAILKTAKDKAVELKENILDAKKESYKSKIDAKKKKDIDAVINKYAADDYQGRKAAIDKINKNAEEEKKAIDQKYDPTASKASANNKGFFSKLIDKQIDKYAPPSDASRIKEMKKDYYEAFKKGDFSAVNKKYQENGLEGNGNVNDFMNDILKDDKIDRRKGIEMIKAKMNESGFDAETQQKYIGMMKDFKDDFNIKSFEDKLSGTRPKDKELQDLLINFENIVNKTSKGRPINALDKELYDNILTRIDDIEQDIANDPTRPQNDDINAIKDYVQSIQSKIDIKDEDVMNTTKQIIDFKQIAHYFSILIKFLATICIVIFLIVLLISFFNIVNLSIKILTNIVSIFYNNVITNNQTISYEAKNITKCSKGNYKNDIFNILNEQFTSLSVFNTIVYIIYILLGYVIIFILLIIFVNIYRYTHVLNGELKDIDPKYQLMTVLIIIFVTSFIHLLIYKFFFRKLTMNKYKEIDNYETNVDAIIRKNLQPVNKANDEDFFDLLTDASRRTEIDNILANKVNDIDDPTSDLAKYLFMYDIYMYFDEYSNMNDIVRDELKNYFKIGDKESTRTFISFLDANERKLIKLYHEELPFYKQIPKEKLERFQKMNEKVSQDIAIINKNIIKYTGTFYPFLFACIYIILIFLFNVLCTYILMDFVLSTEKDELFMPIIYTIADKYKNLILYIYNIFKKS